MNKDVKVTGMQMKAHAEEGLLINEVASPSSDTWDDLAIAGDASYTALRPASTYNLTNWWHANSKKSSTEAGYGSGAVDENTYLIATGQYYTELSGNGSGAAASYQMSSGSGNTSAEKTVFYKNASFGSNNSGYDDGEGYYLMYKYYIKSSGENGMTVGANQFQVKVTATDETESTSGTKSTKLDNALRVGVMVKDSSNHNEYIIFAPLNDADAEYKVTEDTAGSSYKTVSTTAGSSAANYSVGQSSYVSLNKNNTLALPAVSENGLEVDVFVWFEGEDSNCKSDNLTTVLDSYQIDLNFKINDLVG